MAGSRFFFLLSAGLYLNWQALVSSLGQNPFTVEICPAIENRSPLWPEVKQKAKRKTLIEASEIALSPYMTRPTTHLRCSSQTELLPQAGFCAA
jgi:hypothetical protein